MRKMKKRIAKKMVNYCCFSPILFALFVIKKRLEIVKFQGVVLLDRLSEIN